MKSRWVLIWASVILSACANSGYEDMNRQLLLSRYNDTGRPSSSSGTGSARDYRCAGTTNVAPDYDRWLDGSMYFEVCEHADSAYKILVHGKTRSSNTICIYPAQVINESTVYLKPDLTTGGPLKQCSEVGSDGVFADFDLVNYNAVFVVEKQDEMQMSSCLLGGNYAFCPVYSFGRFR